MAELFLILDITGHDTWGGALATFCEPAIQYGGPLQIPALKRATVLQTDRKVAEQEATRLAWRNPGRTFALFQASHVTAAMQETTHVNFQGRPVRSQHVVRLLPLQPPPPPAPPPPLVWPELER